MAAPAPQVDSRLTQALAALGLRSGATGPEAEAAYFAQRCSLAARDDAEAELARLERAIRVIRLREPSSEASEDRDAGPAPDADRLARAHRLLGLRPGATAAEVEAAMATVRETVTAPDRLREFARAAYLVKTCGRTRRSRASLHRVSRFLILSSVTLVVLAVFSGFQLASRFRHHYVHFETGDLLYRLDEGTPYGIVLGFEERHVFPNGTQQDAYQIRLNHEAKDAWISAVAARSALTTRH
jgi:hypothetical protein